MHEMPNSAVEDGLALENAGGSAAAHSDDIAARERNDPARDRGDDGCFVEHRKPRPHAYDGGGIKALKPKPIGGRQRENMTLSGEKALLACFAKAAGAGEMLNVHDLKAAYGDRASDQQQHDLQSSEPAWLA